MNRRSREAANDLARRAIEAAERRQATETAGEDVAKRLEVIADADGRVSVDEALGALNGEERGPWNPFTDPDYQAREAAKQRSFRSRLFPEPESAPPPERPEGDADAGRPTDHETRVEHVSTDAGPERMTVFDLDNDTPDERNNQ